MVIVERHVQVVLKVLPPSQPSFNVPSDGPFSCSRPQRCRQWPRRRRRGYRSSPYPHKINRWLARISHSHCPHFHDFSTHLFYFRNRNMRWHPRRHLPRRTHHRSPIPRRRIRLHVRLPRILGLSRHPRHHHPAAEHRRARGPPHRHGRPYPVRRRSL